jgi:hypothetical protein
MAIAASVAQTLSRLEPKGSCHSEAIQPRYREQASPRSLSCFSVSPPDRKLQEVIGEAADGWSARERQVLQELISAFGVDCGPLQANRNLSIIQALREI